MLPDRGAEPEKVPRINRFLTVDYAKRRCGAVRVPFRIRIMSVDPAVKKSSNEIDKSPREYTLQNCNNLE